MADTHKINCWECRNCGMEPGGIFARIYGPCPVAANSMKYDGINDGRGAGRTCWRFLQENSRGLERQVCRFGRSSCVECAFYRRVHNEEDLSVAETMPAPA